MKSATDNEMRELRELLRKANLAYTQEEIAQAIGCGRQHVNDFLNGKTGLGPSRARRAREFLENKRVFVEPGEQTLHSEPFSDDALGSTASDLIALANIMNSPEYSKKFKIRKFAAWVKVAFENLDDIVKAMEGRKNR